MGATEMDAAMPKSEVEYVETKRGLIALTELPARGSLPACWFWSLGWTQGEEPTRAYALTEAYITLVRAYSRAQIVATG